MTYSIIVVDTGLKDCFYLSTGVV